MHRRFATIALSVIIALGLVVCAPATVPQPTVPAASPSSASAAGTSDAAPPATAPAAVATTLVSPVATAVPSAAPSSAPASASTRGKLFAGSVKHAGQPVPHARVELREPGWATNRTPAVATVEADAQGDFSLANPPAGDFSVIGYFADGEMDTGGWPPVSIAAGQEITGFIVPLERRLTLLSPIAGAVTPASPLLKWKANDEAVKYRLWVIDAGTTEMLLDQTTSGTSVVFTKTLKPGVYQWVVNGLNAQGALVASGDDTFTVGGANEPTATPAPASTGDGADQAAGLPPTCQPRSGQTAVYADRERGFCFLYPASFQKNALDPGQVNVVGVVAGPALDKSADPLRATLLIEAVLADNEDLKAVVAELTREFEGQPGITITQRPFDLGGVPAVLLEGVPGRGGSRDVVAVQNGFRFRLLFVPDPQQGFPQVANDMQALFDSVTQSFTFFIPAVGESQGSVTQPGNMPRLPDEERAFDGARGALAKRLGVDPLAIQRVEMIPQEWSDACLGVASAGEMCAQVITPGWIVTLDVNGQRYEAHTDQEGAQVRFVGLQ